MIWRCCRRCPSCSQVESLLHKKDKGQNLSTLQKQHGNVLAVATQQAGQHATPCNTCSMNLRLRNQRQCQHITITEYQMLTAFLKVDRIKAVNSFQTKAPNADNPTSHFHSVNTHALLFQGSHKAVLIPPCVLDASLG